MKVVKGVKNSVGAVVLEEELVEGWSRLLQGFKVVAVESRAAMRERERERDANGWNE